MSPQKKDLKKSTPEQKSLKKSSGNHYERAGQPTKYLPEYCDDLIQSGREGKLLVQFANSKNVHIDTVYEWAKKHPEFSEAKKKAQQLAEGWFIERGQKAIAYSPKDFNTGLWIFFMKAKFGWQEDMIPETENITIEFVS